MEKTFKSSNFWRRTNEELKWTLLNGSSYLSEKEVTDASIDSSLKEMVISECSKWIIFVQDGDTPQFKAKVHEIGEGPNQDYGVHPMTSGPKGECGGPQMIEFDLFAKTVLITVILPKESE